MKRILLLSLLIILSSRDQSFSQQAEELAKQISNPVASLISVPMQFNFQFNLNGPSGDLNGYRMLLNVQPVVPVSLGKNINLINRLIVPLSTQKDVTGLNKKEEGLGDIVYQGFISPKKSVFIWGLGPVLSFPSATNDVLGTKKLLAGPAVVTLVQPGGWTIGFLGYSAWSVAGDKERSDVSIGYLQPFINYAFKGGLTLGVTSENVYDWKSKKLTSGLVSLLFSQVIKLGTKQLGSIALVPLGFYANKDVVKPQWGARVAMTLLFPTGK